MIGTDVANWVQLALDIVNTGHVRSNRAHSLETTGDLAAIVQSRRLRTLVPRGTQAELAEARGLRSLLQRALQELGSAESVSAINSILLSAGSVPQLSKHPGHEGHASRNGYHLHYTDDSAPFMSRVSALCGIGLALLIESDEFKRVKQCAAEGCSNAFLDKSKNASRMYCSGSRCGNRTHATRYRERQKIKAD